MSAAVLCWACRPCQAGRPSFPTWPASPWLSSWPFSESCSLIRPLNKWVSALLAYACPAWLDCITQVPAFYECVGGTAAATQYGAVWQHQCRDSTDNRHTALPGHGHSLTRACVPAVAVHCVSMAQSLKAKSAEFATAQSLCVIRGASLTSTTGRRVTCDARGLANGITPSYIEGTARSFPSAVSGLVTFAMVSPGGAPAHVPSTSACSELVVYNTCCLYSQRMHPS